MGAVDDSIGAFVVGTVISVFLAGSTSTQVWTYYRTWVGDTRLNKVLVGLLIALDLFHTAISCYTIYLWCVSHFGDLPFLALCPWSFAIEPAVTGMVTWIVQTFYGFRVYVISRRKLWLAVTIWGCSLIQLGFSIGATAEIFLFDREFVRFPAWTYGVSVWLGTAALGDALITSSMVFYLRQHTGEYQRSNSIVSKILRNTIETNGLTLAVALVDALLFALFPHASWHVIPNLSLVKLYFNSVLVSLNSRRRVAPLAKVDDWTKNEHYAYRAEGSHGSGGTGSSETLADGAQGHGGQGRGKGPEPQGVQGVQVITHELVETDSANSADRRMASSVPRRPERGGLSLYPSHAF